jgi:epoxyqueuosine reductase
VEARGQKIPKKRVAYRLQTWLGHTRFIVWVGVLGRSGRFRFVPPLPKVLKRWNSSAAPLGARSLEVPLVPKRLLTTAGIPRDPAAEESAFKESRLPDWVQVYPDAAKIILDAAWLAYVPTYPARERWQHKLLTAPLRRAGANPDTRDPDTLTRAVKEHAATIGLSAIGVAQFDRKYHQYANDQVSPDDLGIVGQRVIVCVLQTNKSASETAPSVRSERAVSTAYAQLGELVYKLSDHVRSLGYAASGVVNGGSAIYIHYAVAAGLGQLGLNGQLLTPFAGSACRLAVIHTDAPLALDLPKDYGIPAICDACRVCVRRCPPGAITSVRDWHRGVYKAKIKTERCLPIVAQVDGCAICTKVCPVQRYGLAPVLEEFGRSSRILGKGTDELEGYTWPVDGKRYGPGQKPKSAMSKEMLHPGGYVHDPHRRKSPAGDLASHAKASPIEHEEM